MQYILFRFSKAINYYETALKNQKESQLLYDLAELYFKLKNYDKATRVITEALGEYKQHKIPDLPSSMEESRLLVLLARVHANNDQQDEALNMWRLAHQVHFNLYTTIYWLYLHIIIFISLVYSPTKRWYVTS